MKVSTQVLKRTWKKLGGEGEDRGLREEKEDDKNI